MKKGADGKSWPMPRQAISESESVESQREKLSKWLDKSLAEYFKEYGSFKFDANKNLNEEDFLRIYDLIESVGRFELKELREENEKSRKQMFADAFGTAGAASENT